MWKVVGYGVRDVEKGRYYDLFLQREAQAPAQGVEVLRGDYSAKKISYIPTIGDIVVVSFDSYNGRRYISEVYKVK